VTNPIDQPNYNPATFRPPNPATIAQIEDLGKEYSAALNAARDLRHQLDAAIIEAKEVGHSYHQLREASGLSIATIQKILERKEYR